MGFSKEALFWEKVCHSGPLLGKKLFRSGFQWSVFPGMLLQYTSEMDSHLDSYSERCGSSLAVLFQSQTSFFCHLDTNGRPSHANAASVSISNELLLPFRRG